MGAAARERAERHYAWPDIAARLEGIYDRVVDGERVSEARAA
jgi:glycosyltransferase involved in cell wall biosynthesis